MIRGKRLMRREDIFMGASTMTFTGITIFISQREVARVITMRLTKFWYVLFVTRISLQVADALVCLRIAPTLSV
ncbi:hypothetical protein FOZ62_000914 [Perkinsus olseni]|uniref:Uncharacterized protein n=1 Tax=Perkinsus olseni TaxID=32597 RepID=A0A7J6SD70_PEROL|nr:hypothetical protein FOZ62_000914 [Perkinsus olseni]